MARFLKILILWSVIVSIRILLGKYDVKIQMRYLHISDVKIQDHNVHTINVKNRVALR